MIEILKASAGSGKTYNLAKKYIELLLENKDRYAYRHILAVTFTNKATDEMKTRILKELHILATEPCKSAYYGDFVPKLCADSVQLQKISRTVLCNILHDYGAFAVSTIDRFFQQTLKAFSREIGQFASYQVELDKDSLIAESVDRVLDSLTGEEKDAKKLKWLTDNTISRLEEGEGYKLDSTLLNVAKRLKSEQHRALIDAEGMDEGEIYDREALKRLSEGCEQVCKAFVVEVRNAVAALAKAFSDAGIDPADTTRSFMSKCIEKYSSLKEGDVVSEPTDSFMRTSADTDKWFPKSKARLSSQITDGIENSLAAFKALFDTPYKVYNTAQLLKNQVYGFGIANDLYHEFNALLKEKNVLSLDDSNTILKNIIDGTDTPFIYEKLGVRYEHFLLDEFQDTSRVQWENFRPLLSNSVAGGFYNLIVGDVKQSIYRWRNSDWKLLRDEITKEFDDTVTDTLQTNWRSFGNIVAFNNEFFTDTAAFLDEKYGFEAGKGEVSEIYRDVCQKTAKDGSGAVQITFVEKERQPEYVLEAVREAVSHGYSYKDIAVLVRGNKEGAEIASYLIADKVRVVTDDSLLISSSLTVRRLVSLLSSIDNPDDSMARFLARKLEVSVPLSYDSLIDLCEELLRQLRVCDEGVFDAEVLYIQSFMDVLRDFVSLEGSSLHGFLKAWETNTQCISSPSSGDAVRVMTIHKSKGLDFPYVIVPFIENVGLSRHEKKWCRPHVEGTPLEGAATGIYDVTLSSKSEKTLFDTDYRTETLMQYVDNINVMYVALTRAAECMHLIAAASASSGNDFSWILDRFIHSDKGRDLGILPADELTRAFDDGLSDALPLRYIFGEIPQHERKETERNGESMPLRFLSWRLNPEEGDSEMPVGERGRLKFTADAYDFFAQDGSAGVAASHRVKGIVLHDILSSVRVREDLRSAVEAAVSSGQLAVEEADEVFGLLDKRISETSERGWFPEDTAKILNETTLIDTDGQMYRPDRVVISDKKVMIIDYKFGEHYRKYERQLKKYADMWRRMGYDDVSSFLWYVQTGEVIAL